MGKMTVDGLSELSDLITSLCEVFDKFVVVDNTRISLLYVTSNPKERVPIVLTVDKRGEWLIEFPNAKEQENADS